MVSALIAGFRSQKELLYQTGLSFIARVLAALAGFIVSLVIGRYLGAEGAGYYFLAFSILMFLSAISRVGLDDSVIKYTGAAVPQGEWGEVRDVIKKSLLVAFIFSAFSACALYFLSDFIAQFIFEKPELSSVLQAISPGVVGLSLFTLIAMSLQGLRRVIASVFTVNITVNLLLVLAIVSLEFEASDDVAFAYSVASGLTVVIGGYLLLSSVSKGRGRIAWGELFQSCMPLWIVVLMQQTVQWSGQFIAGVWVESEQVAQFAVAQRTALLVTFILMAVNLVVAPRFANMYKQGRTDQLERLALTSVKLMLVFAFPVVLVMLVFPEYIMGLFGPGFRGGALLLQILAIGQLINVATGSVGYLLTMSGHEKEMRNATLISGPIALGLGFLLTPVFGVTGAAVATSIAIAVQNLVAVWWVRKRLGFNTLAVWR